MHSHSTDTKLAHQFDFVKSSPKDAKALVEDMYLHPFWPLKDTRPHPLCPRPDIMIHHKVSLSRSNKIIVSYSKVDVSPYGVSQSYRVLSPQILLKKFNYVRDSLEYVLGMTPAQREVTLRLLTLWAYYGNVYPKEAMITSQPGCSKATFWRTIRFLKEQGVIQVINRFVFRPHAQISNLYRLDRLILLIARYLAEHGTAFLEKWLQPYLTMPCSHFWRRSFIAARETDFEGRAVLTDPCPLGARA